MVLLLISAIILFGADAGILIVNLNKYT